jgi:hypothetical protein
MSERPWKWNRCVFIEGIGRVHALGPRERPHVAAMDADGVAGLERAMLAADILAGIVPGKIIWSVRFKEHEA